jgi:hypothetical protein
MAAKATMKVSSCAIDGLRFTFCTFIAFNFRIKDERTFAFRSSIYFEHECLFFDCNYMLKELFEMKERVETKHVMQPAVA